MISAHNDQEPDRKRAAPLEIPTVVIHRPAWFPCRPPQATLFSRRRLDNGAAQVNRLEQLASAPVGRRREHARHVAVHGQTARTAQRIRENGRGGLELRLGGLLRNRPARVEGERAEAHAPCLRCGARNQHTGRRVLHVRGVPAQHRRGSPPGVDGDELCDAAAGALGQRVRREPQGHAE